MKFFNAEVIEKRDVGIDEIRSIEVWKGGAEGFSCFRIDRRRPGRAITAAEVIAADDEEAIGVDGFSRSYHFVPPTAV